jgi:hypothetical protein
MALDGEIMDSMSVLGLLLAARRRGEESGAGNLATGP